MRTKKFLLPVGLLLLIGSCKKNAYTDLAGQGTLKGVVVIADTLNGRYAYAAAPNTTVYLKYIAGTAGFLYSSTANSQGQYTFSGIDSSIGYTVYATMDTGPVKCYGELTYPASNFNDNIPDSIKLYPSPNNQNGIHLILQDSTQGKVANTTAWVFNSPLRFYAGDSATDKAFDMTTNEFGVSNKFNIAPGKYFVRVRTKINGADFKGEDSVYVEAAGIKPLLVTVRKLPANTNGLELLVLDENLMPVNGAQLYGYRSRTVSLLDSTYGNKDFMLSSDASGMASRYNLDSARYYIRSIRQVGSVALKSYDSVTVGKTGIAKQTIRLKVN